MFSYKELSALMGLVVRNSVELQAQLHDKKYESDLEKESLERELQFINEVGAKISEQINKNKSELPTHKEFIMDRFTKQN